jgi:pyruvate formate lyase activating enzyme
MQRRDFIRNIGQAAAASLAVSTCPGILGPGPAYGAGIPREARFYLKREKNVVQCQLCPWQCVVAENGRGVCRARVNRQGTYYTMSYGNPCSTNIDPIEKKPLYHFLPGAQAFSLATGGCNFRCKFCQNWQIAQTAPDELRSDELAPEAVVERALAGRSRCLAFTYSEPIVFYEYMYDMARLAKAQGLRSVVISNGFINEEPLRELAPHIAAYKVDLKSFSEKYYQEVCEGQLKPVLNTLVLLKSLGVWNEIVYLVLPTLNDSDREIRDMSKWILANLGPEVPLHFSRFHPSYRMEQLPSTPVATLERLRAIAQAEGLHYVYVGNVPGHDGNHTWCPACKKMLVRRDGYQITRLDIRQGKCAFCGQTVAGVWA